MQFCQIGSKQFDYYDSHYKPGQMYDTTRAIISEKPVMLAGKPVYDCFVSWYGENDAEYFDKGIKTRKDIYEHVLAEIDTNAMLEDPTYLESVIKGLLNENRVRGYIERGLQSEEELLSEAVRTKSRSIVPCGRYVGGILRGHDEQGEYTYSKIFNASVGRVAHKLPEMVTERTAYKEGLEKSRQARINAKKAQIVKLQAEIESEER